MSRLRSLIVRFETLWRYYGAGIINTAFGYGLFAGLVWLGLNLFVAQIVAHVTGTIFNYFMFKRFVFTNSEPALARYIASYAVNYLIGLGFLVTVRMVIHSPYAAGLLAIICTSAVNYLILKLIVFRSRRTG